MQRMERPQQRARDGHQVISGKLQSQAENQQHADHIKDQLIEMKSPGSAPATRQTSQWEKICRGR